MKKRSLLALLFLILPFSLGISQNKNVEKIINQNRVEQILATLSADSMLGREAFTTGIEKSASYISNYFEELELEPFNNLTSYREHFVVHEFKPVSSHLVLNDKNIEKNDYFFTSTYKNLEIDFENISVNKISGEDDFEQAFSDIIKSQDNQLILIDDQHKQLFERYQMYYGRSTESFDLGTEPTRIFIVTEEKEVENGKFKMSQSLEKKKGSNIVGQIKGTRYPNEYVLFTAHYDHIGTRKTVEADSIANGADDNASGTTGILMLAEYFKNIGPQPRTIIFVAFSAEEAGGYGSKYFSQQVEPQHVKAMFNIEMIGKPSRFGPNSAFLTGFKYSNMGQILQDNLENTPYMIYADPYPQQKLFYRSDNEAFARLGVPAHTISSVQIDQDSYYHTVNDEIETLNLSQLINMIRAIALSSGSILTGKDTPQRINTENIE